MSRLFLLGSSSFGAGSNLFCFTKDSQRLSRFCADCGVKPNDRLGMLLFTLSRRCSIATFLCCRFSVRDPVSRNKVSRLAAHFSANLSTDPSFHFWLLVISSLGGELLDFVSVDFRSTSSGFASSGSSCEVGIGSRASGGGGTGAGGGVLMPVRAEVKLGGLSRVSARPRGLSSGLVGAGGGEGEGVSRAPLWYSAS